MRCRYNASLIRAWRSTLDLLCEADSGYRRVRSTVASRLFIPSSADTVRFATPGTEAQAGTLKAVGHR